MPKLFHAGNESPNDIRTPYQINQKSETHCQTEFLFESPMSYCSSVNKHIKILSYPITTSRWGLKNSHKYGRGCYRDLSSVNSCSLFLSSPQMCLAIISTSLPPPFGLIWGVWRTKQGETLQIHHSSRKARLDFVIPLGKDKVQIQNSITSMENIQWKSTPFT